MRFTAPVTLSPPVRKRPARRESSNIFRAPSTDESSTDYDSSDDGSDTSESFSQENTSEEDEDWEQRSRTESIEEEEGSDVELQEKFGLVSINPSWKTLAAPERQVVQEIVSSIRARSQHVDLYEEWAKKTKKDAFNSARKSFVAIRQNRQEEQVKQRYVEREQTAARRAENFKKMSSFVHQLEGSRRDEELRLRAAWGERDRRLWENVEASIKAEEEKIRARLEAEQRAREEEERRRQEAEVRKRREEEERQKKLAEEKLKKEQEEREERERLDRESEEKRRSELEKDAQQIRYNLGFKRSEELWVSGLRTLKELKNGPMRVVKGPKPPDPLPSFYAAPAPPALKKIWSAQRRKITPKVGQLTDDPREIARISEELKAIVAPVQGTPEALHIALLSSLSKIIIRQAETEVTAHKEQAGPLAQVAVNLISTYPPLADIFWAKLCDLVGCWIVPIEPSPYDLTVEGDNKPQMSDKQKAKVWGVREDEAQDTQTIRITGVLRLYCQMLFVPVPQPLNPLFRPARFWSFLTQLLSNPGLLRRPVAPEAIYVALDVGGLQAKAIWGKQWIKLLAFIYQSVQGDGKEKIGGSDAAAQASRVRCQMDIEKIMAAP